MTQQRTGPIFYVTARKGVDMNKVQQHKAIICRRIATAEASALDFYRDMFVKTKQESYREAYIYASARAAHATRAALVNMGMVDTRSIW